MKRFNITVTNEIFEQEIDIGDKMDVRMQLLRKHMNRPTTNGIDYEIMRFANIETHESNVLEFWRVEESHFPTMASVAKVLLGKPASSAASESAFSVAGALLAKRRASIDPLRARKILFIHDNYDMLHGNET